MQQNKKIVILAGKGDSTTILCNSLLKRFNIDAIIIEDAVPMKMFLKRRIKNLGIWKVIGQIFFQILIVKPLSILSKKRVNEILTNNELSLSLINTNKIITVNSVNDDYCLEQLKKIQPDIVVVNGTRIISKKILQSVNAVFINTHAGITPKYRGVHGAYWALANNDVTNCGVTVHCVDAGIDTGNIISQQLITPTPKDNFATYPYLQLAAGIPLLTTAINQLIHEKLQQKQATGVSKLWYHPTFWQYLLLRAKGVK